MKHGPLEELKKYIRRTEENKREYKDVYVSILQAYCNHIERSSKQRALLKYLFFGIICFIMIMLLALFFVSVKMTYGIMCDMVKEHSGSFEIVAGAATSMVSSFATVVIALLSLPKIIANYLFDKGEDQLMNEIIKNIQVYDIGITGAADVAHSKAKELKTQSNNDTSFGQVDKPNKEPQRKVE